MTTTTKVMNDEIHVCSRCDNPITGVLVNHPKYPGFTHSTIEECDAASGLTDEEEDAAVKAAWEERQRHEPTMEHFDTLGLDESQKLINQTPGLEAALYGREMERMHLRRDGLIPVEVNPTPTE